MSRFPHVLLHRLGFTKQESRTDTGLPESKNGAAYFLPVPFSLLLRSYFRSGWAFFIPYLAAYLLYAWLKWPVNPGSTVGRGMEHGAGVWVPCLLHVYWGLHGIHVILAGVALLSWWKGLEEEQAEGSKEQVTEPPLPVTGYRLLASACLAIAKRRRALWHLAPWALLALVFYIPGIYLEWPSDPWEHLRRINEWHALDTVTAHSAWKKSSYFLPYSLTGHTYGLSQLSWLNFYYTGICLLLSWQYYRLARAVGLGERASFVFVLLNALTFGNNTFSFYRYYGLSSSVLAQLGAVALTRVALEALGGAQREQGAGGRQQASEGSNQVPTSKGQALEGEEQVLRSKGQGVGQLLPGTSHRLPHTAHGPLVTYTLLLIPCSLLLVFTLFNHIQGLGIAGLGVLAVVVWRLIEWRRVMILWLAGCAIVLSCAFYWWMPITPALLEEYRRTGWLATWHGFGLLDPTSAAAARAFAILGAIGLVDLLCAIWLLRRNDMIGYLIVSPIIALALPCVALPYVQQLLTSGQPILVYHRMLLVIPVGLAITAVGTRVISWDRPLQTTPITPFSRRLFAPANSLLLIGLDVVLLLPPGIAGFGRAYHALMCPPDDSALRNVLAYVEQAHETKGISHAQPLFIATVGISSAALSAGVVPVAIPHRAVYVPPRDKVVPTMNALRTAKAAGQNAVYFHQPATTPFSSGSHMGYLSRHWLPAEVAFEYTNGLELEAIARSSGFRKHTEAGKLSYWYRIDQ